MMTISGEISHVALGWEENGAKVIEDLIQTILLFTILLEYKVVQMV